MDSTRPYIVIPKLIEQPTWGGMYIVDYKGWNIYPEFAGRKIGQSYELFNGSNLSLAITTKDSQLTGEMADPANVAKKTSVPNAVSLSDLISANPAAILGAENVGKYGPQMHLLIKFTQALGNSFQLHIKDGVTHPKWKPKPESWYYFEPGYITLGVKEDVDWNEYKLAMTELNSKILAIGYEVAVKKMTYENAQQEIAGLIKHYNPWQYVHTFKVDKETLIDLSPCGIHHSWEEDPSLPLGNVLIELQLDVADSVATIRNFDKGKMAKDGTTRPLQIEDYFEFIDRDPKTNNPQSHMSQSKLIKQTNEYSLDRLMHSKYYSLDKLTFLKPGTYTEKIDTFRHIFVKEEAVELIAGTTTLSIGKGHSAFIPAGAKEYTIKATAVATQVLISY